MTDAAATGVVMVILALAAAAAVAIAVAAKVVVRRFVASAKTDFGQGRLSLATAGYGFVLLWACAFVLSSLAGSRSSGGLASLIWAISDFTFIVVFTLSLCYAPAKVGELARTRRDSGQAVSHFWWWVAAAVASAGLTLALMSQVSSYPRMHAGADGFTTFVLFAFVAGLGLAQVAAVAWAWNGRPDVVRSTLARIRQRATMPSPDRLNAPPDEPN
jgi:hypothetical protein